MRHAPALALLFALPLLTACPGRQVQFPDYVVVSLAPGPDLEFRAREAIALAPPGTLIEFPAGTYEFTDELVITNSHITLRGQGPDQTTLDFTNQQTGGQGILATGDAFAIQGLRVLNPKGDGVRVEGADGVIFQNLHVVWSGEPRSENGAYGIYPVLSRNVLIERCFVRGASDAGIYVGQSETVIVRFSRAESNVAGIEIENTKDADVYFNTATDNTGGLLVFDAPGLQRDGCRVFPGSEDPPGCKGTRVFLNSVYDNNRPNFAAGGTVALVPRGTGFLLLSTDKIEIFLNSFRDNDSINLAVITSELLVDNGALSIGNDLDFDPWTEHVDIHHNLVTGGGTDPDSDNSELILISRLLFQDVGLPQIVFDGYIDPAKAGTDGNLPPELQICIRDNFDGEGGEPLYGSLNRLQFPVDMDASKRDCSLPPREETFLEPLSEAPEVEPPFTPEEIAELCDAGAPVEDGVNFAAGVVDCPELSSYRLFEDPTNPTRDPNGGVPFDLTTPLFSDYALKDRFVFVPPGQQVQYSADGAFEFPVGTIIAKSFSFAEDLRAPEGPADLIETRLLIRRPDGWRGVAYIWNEARTEAFLALGGGAVDVAWTHTDGSARSTNYQIPNTGQCLRCHTHPTDGAVPIGPRAKFLNRPLDYGTGPENQLAHWSTIGLLAGAPADPATAPRVPVWNDPADGTLEERAKGYIDVNCAFCHRPGGAARQSGLYLESERAVNSQYGVCKKPVSAGPGAGGLDWDLVPGDADASILFFRMTRNEAQIKMPELSRSVVHEEGVALVREWIESLPGSCP